MPRTLRSVVLRQRIEQIIEQAEASACSELDTMSNSEFLTILSDGLEELLGLPNTHLPD